MRQILQEFFMKAGFCNSSNFYLTYIFQGPSQLGVQQVYLSKGNSAHIPLNAYISPWKRNQTGIKLGTKHVIYQNLASFL